MSKRKQTEFYCNKSGGGCGGYFLAFLRENMFGNYVIKCPSCGHEHFRVIKEGVITDDRHHEKLGEATVVLGLNCTYRLTPYHDDPAYKRSLMGII